MDSNLSPRPLIWEQWARRLGRRVREYQIPLLCCMIVGALCYMFALTNKLVNHDDVFTLFFKGGTLSLGRWGLGLLDSVFPDYSMPWINGVLTLLFMSVSVCVMLDVFRIQNKLVQSLLAGCVIAFPSLIGTMTYMFTAAPYALAFLLSVAAVAMLRRSLKTGFLPAVVLMILSLSIYQSYVAVSTGFLVLLLIRDLLYGEDVVPTVRRGLWYVGFLILSLGIYYGATMVFNRFLGTSFNSYATGNLSFDFRSIPADIVQAYVTFARCITEGFQGLLPTPFSRVVHWIFLAVSAVLLVLWAGKQSRPRTGRFLLLGALLAILPLAVCCMHLFTSEDAVHTLVLYSFICIYVLGAVLAQWHLDRFSGGAAALRLSRLSLHAVTGAMAVIIAINIFVANEAYLNLYLRYENAHSFYTALVADLKQMPEFDQDTKLAVIGSYRSPDFYYENFYHTDQITGAAGFLPDNYSKERFLEYYLGLSIPFASEEEIAAIQETEEFAEMPVYPYYGSMKMFGDICVVRLS